MKQLVSLTMKKVMLFMICCMAGVTSVNAQDSMFEGELLVENYIHMPSFVTKEYPEAGFHQIRLIMKGSRIHQIDETTGEHFIIDKRTKEEISFIPAIKLAADWGMMPTAKDKQDYNNNVVRNTLSMKKESKEILGHQCTLYDGQVIRKYESSTTEINMPEFHIETLFTDDVKLYLSDLPKCAYGNVIEENWGVELKGLPLKWAFKTTTTSKSYSKNKKLQKMLSKNDSSFSVYSEFDVVKITPRTVNDDEFEIPKGYDVITSVHDKAFTTYMKERGKLRGGDASLKTTGVHYKADGEWDF